MKILNRLYHFLGGINFTLVLIASVALFVIAGTFIESSTQSHRFAADFTYSNPIFGLLLWGFFANILFSATRRWPFQVRHIPFLITHFGLLMILAGVMAKHYFGIQGTMSIVEGSGSDEIFELGSHAIQLEKPDHSVESFLIQGSYFGGFNSIIADTKDGLHLRLGAYAPHSTERLATWIKGKHAFIDGLQPMPVHEVDVYADLAIPVSGKVQFFPSSAPWKFYAIRSDQIEAVIAKLYADNSTLVFSDRLDDKLSSLIPLSEALRGDAKLSAHLDLSFSSVEGFTDPRLELSIGLQKLNIALQGQSALLNDNKTHPQLGNNPIAVDIKSDPLLAMIEDEHHDVHLVSFDSHGRVWWKVFCCNDLKSLLSYGDGFGGYAVQAELPFTSEGYSRQDYEKALTSRLKDQLKLAMKENIDLSPPLQLWKNACVKCDADMADSLVLFLSHWNNTNRWIYPADTSLPTSLHPILSAIDWMSFAPREKQASEWASIFFADIESELQLQRDILALLKEKQWPLLPSILQQYKLNESRTNEDTITILNMLTQQIFSAAEIIPDIKKPEKDYSHEQQASLFSAYLRAYGIHLNTITTAPQSEEEMLALLKLYSPTTPLQETPIVIETSVNPIQQPKLPTSKLEDHTPLIKLYVRKGNQSQSISLSYDQNGNGLKWPVLNGEYLVRYQPAFISIPYRLRLRNARQINYPNSSQPYSFESDLIITDNATGLSEEKTISMNHVHETWDGYRFYLASMTPVADSGVKRIQVVVNHDPAKYWLTYPGAIILTCGIMLLFTMGRKRK